MSAIDQRPSSKHEPPAPTGGGASAGAEAGGGGKTFWRSLDELAGTAEFREFLEREFPAHASELLDGSRRHFLKIMGASLALAGAAAAPGCRRPEHNILAYNETPEEIIPGKPLYYATALPVPGGGAEGLLAETFEGRPTKLEGNPLHGYNRGSLGSRTQAEILSLYDPDRAPEAAAALAEAAGAPMAVEGWSSVKPGLAAQFEAFDASGGAGLVFLVDKAPSPSRDRLRDAILARWPNAQWLPYDPTDEESAREGVAAAYGGPHKLLHAFDKADVVLSLDADFLGGADARLDDIRGWAANRIREGEGDHAAADTKMSRLYAAEAAMTLTGAQADHRLALRPAAIAALGVRVAAAVLDRLEGGPAAGARAALRQAVQGPAQAAQGFGLSEAWVKAVAADLVAHRGRCLIVAGPSQPASVHALVAALNGALGVVGQTVIPVALDERSDLARSSAASIAALASALGAGARMLVTIGCNPVYDAPADLKIGEALARGLEAASFEHIHLGDHDETAAMATTHVGRSHFLEAWGDAATLAGDYSVTQPMIRPLYDTASELEVLSAILGDGPADGHDVVKATFAARTRRQDEKAWRRVLHDGVRAATGSPRGGAPDGRLAGNALAGLAAYLSGPDGDGGVDLLFTPCEKLRDGRLANNGWLQELPHPVTKVSWDNPALVSMATAKRLGLRTGRRLKGPQYNHVQVATVTSAGRTLEIPVLVQPGMADGVVQLHLGHGRRAGGRIAAGTGFDAFRLRSSGGLTVARGTVEPARGRAPYLLANTQDHWSMEGRAIVRESDVHHWREAGDEDFTPHDDHVTPAELEILYGGNYGYADQYGLESHTPTNAHIYNRPGRLGGEISYRKIDEAGALVVDARGRPQPRENKYGKPIQQWGMTIDLTTCIGCEACITACQAENNIPIVGKTEVAKGREMHWIRVDRYYSSTKMDEAAYAAPDVSLQPVACVHCEAAPCEVVCPVNATIHGDEGLNVMAYNRCIGTRYCSNNCPYKVRRFNYFDYATKQFRGGFGQLGAALPDGAAPPNEHFVPPRLREPVAEVQTMQNNPHVTVRSRGVMEKCTYCIQRINAARVETKLNDLDKIPDGFFQVACEQACPSGAIVFGDIYDYASNGGRGSRVHRSRRSGRSYALLAYLNTRPRTSHLMRLRNANTALLEALAAAGDGAAAARLEEVKHPSGYHGRHDDGHGHGGGSEGDSHAEGRIMSLPILGEGALA